MHHVVKDHIFIVLLSCEKKKEENLLFHTCTRILNECTPLKSTTDYFENESNVYCQNITKLLLTISEAASEGLGPVIQGTVQL